LTLGAPSYFFSVPEYGRCVVNTAPNDLTILRRGTIKVVPDNMAGSVRVGSICFPRQLGLGKKFDFRGALTLLRTELMGTSFFFGCASRSFRNPCFWKPSVLNVPPF